MLGGLFLTSILLLKLHFKSPISQICMHKKDTKCAQLFKRISLADVFWSCAFSASSRIFENVKPFLKRSKKGTRASVAKITGLNGNF